MEVREVPADHAGVRVRQRAEAPPREEADAVQEVGPVAAKRVRRRAPLAGEVAKERGHRRPARLAGRLHELSSSRR